MVSKPISRVTTHTYDLIVLSMYYNMKIEILKSIPSELSCEQHIPYRYKLHQFLNDVKTSSIV